MRGKRASGLAALFIAYVCFGGLDDPSWWIVIQRQEWFMLIAYWTVLIFSVYALGVIVDRLLAFSNASRQTRQFQSKAGEAFLQGQYTAAAHCARLYPASPLAFVVNATLNECGDANEDRPMMRLRQQAIVAKTFELKRHLWHLSAIRSTLELLIVLILCVDVINAEQMIRYEMTFSSQHLAGEFVDSLYFIGFSFIIAFVVQLASKFFTAKLEQFQLEMDRLSLAFIGRITSRPPVVVSPLDPYGTGFIPAKPTVRLQERVGR